MLKSRGFCGVTVVNKIRVEIDESVYKTINTLCHSDYAGDLYALKSLIRTIWDEKNEKRVKHMLYTGMVTSKDDVDKSLYEKEYSKHVGGRMQRKFDI